MGICLSAEQKAEKKRNADINSQIKKDKISQKNEVKMLLLGNTSEKPHIISHDIKHNRCW